MKKVTYILIGAGQRGQRYSNHAAEFVDILNQHMPYWRSVKKTLNEHILDPLQQIDGKRKSYL